MPNTPDPKDELCAECPGSPAEERFPDPNDYFMSDDPMNMTSRQEEPSATPQLSAPVLDFSHWGYGQADLVLLNDLIVGEAYDIVNVKHGRIMQFTVTNLSVYKGRSPNSFYIRGTGSGTFGGKVFIGDAGLGANSNNVWNASNRTFRHKPRT
jgi:hypothetical protein